MIRALWPWALAGLVAPAIVWAGAMIGVDGSSADGLLLTFFYPTWLFGWTAMGVKSEVTGYAILMSTVLGNVAIFSAAGFVFHRLQNLRPLVRWGATAAGYGVLSTFVIFVAYHYL